MADPGHFRDVIFDDNLGGIIYSTEDLFIHLLPMIRPDQILLAGKEPGIWKDYPRNTEIVRLINAADFEDAHTNIGDSASIDVTGGMAAKVQLMLEVVKTYPDVAVQIFSVGNPEIFSKRLPAKFPAHVSKIDHHPRFIVKSAIIKEMDR
jgi:isopentenyl phosphate kinase